MALRRPTFRPYHQDQRLTLPPSLEDLIAPDHSARIVNDVINRINIEPLLKAYHIRGGSNYITEPVFANIKQNHGFRRFMLRGKEKVEIEWGLLAIAQNIRKKAA